MNDTAKEHTATRRAALKAAALGLAAGLTAQGGMLHAQASPDSPSQEPKATKRRRIPMSSGGFSSAGLARMHRVMAGYVESGELPGLVTLVSRRGETHVDAIGSTAFEGGHPMRRDTLFRIASMTKPITATATMILVEECKLRLDDSVDKFLPELANRRILKRFDGPIDDTVPAKRPITVRDLLTFRLGHGLILAPPNTYPIQRAIAEAGIMAGPPAPDKDPAPDEWMRHLGSLPLVYQPGERWMYNTGSDVLGVLIARASGKPFDVFLKERVFEPLEMKDTAFSVPASKLDRFGPSYWTNFQTGAREIFDQTNGQWSHPPAFPAGGSGLVSTVDDYLAFALMLLNFGKHGSGRLLSRASVKAMTVDQLTPEQKPSWPPADFFDTHGWGFGMSVVTKHISPTEPLGQVGWDGGSGTSWRNAPSEQYITLLMTPRMWISPNPPSRHQDFWTTAYAAIDG
jgi:CubicO group peptidase (beta-lactamase class C family)